MDVDTLDESSFQLLAGLSRSILYHDRQQKFYCACKTVIPALGLCLAVVLLIFMLQFPNVVLLLAVMLLFVSCIWAHSMSMTKEMTHMNLSMGFTFLEGFMYYDSISEEDINFVTKKRLDLESNEPPVMYLLNELCQRSYERSIGVEMTNVEIPWWRKMLVNLLSQEDWTKEKFHGLPQANES